MKHRSSPRAYLRFLAIGIAIMVFMDLVLFNREPPPEPVIAPQQKMEPPEHASPETGRKAAHLETSVEVTARIKAPAPPEVKKMEEAKSLSLTPQWQTPAEDDVTPLWRKNAVTAEIPKGFAKVIVIIDDMGVARQYSQEVIALPGPLTLAFLPYAPDVAEMAAEAKQAGHELMVHMPMEPTNPDLDTGPITLKTGQSETEFDETLTKGLEAIKDYVGVNNHMGSRLTQDQAAMNRLMVRLYDYGLIFVDSKTIHTSVAADAAQAHNVPYAVRDVFLDHDPSTKGVAKSLARLERIAQKHGQAIAIGHPKSETIKALREWLPTLAEKKMVLVPISAAITPAEKTILAPKDNKPVNASSPAPDQGPALPPG